MRAKKLYKPNVVYVVEIHGCHYYVGCHCCEKELIESKILSTSGNSLKLAYQRKLITYPEYRECCRLVHVEEYDTREEALNRESELIQRFKDFYGDRCLNKTEGNIFGGTKGFSPTENTRKKLSDSNRNDPKRSKPVRQFTKDGQFVAEYPSIMEAERQTGINSIHIGRVAFKTPEKYTWKGKERYSIPKSAGGYLWESA